MDIEVERQKPLVDHLNATLKLIELMRMLPDEPLLREVFVKQLDRLQLAIVTISSMSGPAIAIVPATRVGVSPDPDEKKQEIKHSNVKTCTKCAETKPLAGFYYNKRTNSYTPNCRSCLRRRSNEHYRKKKAEREVLTHMPGIVEVGEAEEGDDDATDIGEEKSD